MKALTLHQPWATLCVTTNPTTGRAWKTIETRSWKASASIIGQTVAIHAANRQPDPVHVGQFEAAPADPRGKPHPNHPDGRPARLYRNDVSSFQLASWNVLPVGAVVGTVTVVGCVQMVEPDSELVDGETVLALCPVLTERLGGLRLWTQRHEREGVTTTVVDCEDQRPFGHFEAGRWAWLLDNAVAFDTPVPATGRQRLWDW